MNVGTTRAGINMDAVARMGEVVLETARLTADRDGIGCAKLVVFCNAVEDNPFMAGAFHGIGEPECVVNVGVSGPGVVANAVEAEPNADFGALASVIKRTAFKITRMGELVGRAASEKLGVPFGIVDLSLAPTPAPGDSVARVLEAMGLERIGTHGSTAALALLNDAVKKGGAMASSYVGGLSGAFIPVSEDTAMIEAAGCGALTFDKLEAMTCVCSVGLDMIAVPGDTPRVDDRSDHRGRSRDRHDQPQDDRGAADSRARQEGRRRRVVRRAARTRARHRASPRVERSVHRARRADSGAAPGAEQLKRARHAIRTTNARGASRRSRHDAGSARGSRTVYTIGHSNHPIERFLELLRMHAVEAIADVRSHPHSRFNPQFSLKRLRAALEDAGVAYLFLGRELGARSNDPGVYVDGKVDYGRLARTPRFEEGVASVAEPRTSARVALMCAERDPLECHRAILVCPALPRAASMRGTSARTGGSRAARSSKRACSTRLQAMKE